MLAARNEDRLQQLSGELNAPWQMIDGHSIDSILAAAQQAVQQFGRLDGIVCCIGSVILKPAHLTSLADWQETLATNLTSAFGTVRAAYDTMRTHGGSVILMSSAAARIGMANHEAIAAAKAGVVGLMQSAAASYAARKIRFNAIAPGLVQTPLTSRIWQEPKSAEVSRGMHALGRLGEPRDVASLICWLLQPDNDWITGQVFGVDGGLATLRTIRS
ncbi:MAG: Levodione reductase [Planctomycetota bacterium]